jgi:hypothetical protein
MLLICFVRTKFYTLSESNFGSILPNGSWDGIVGMLTRREVDAATANLILTPERAMALDFLAPLLDIR